MPKDRRTRSSLSFEQPRATPYHSNSRHVDQSKPDYSDVEQWDDVRCPICMEPPHNALLLLCSSFEKGCRAYVCDTSFRHSNCFDQFSKSSGRILPVSTVSRPEEILNRNIYSAFCGGRRESRALPVEQSRLQCPLCRGQIHGFVKVKDVREFLNTKGRSCSSEMCDFAGNYSELRKHARSEHPDVQPTEVDPERRCDWEIMEEVTDYEDRISAAEELEVDLSGVLNCWFVDAYLQLEASVEILAENYRRDRRALRLTHGNPSGRRRSFRYGLIWGQWFNNRPRGN